MEQFTLSIELGNEGMDTGGDVADALREVADKVDSRRGGKIGPYTGSPGQVVGAPIMDENGNTVGSFSFED